MKNYLHWWQNDKNDENDDKMMTKWWQNDDKVMTKWWQNNNNDDKVMAEYC